MPPFSRGQTPRSIKPRASVRWPPSMARRSGRRLSWCSPEQTSRSPRRESPTESRFDRSVGPGWHRNGRQIVSELRKPISARVGQAPNPLGRIPKTKSKVTRRNFLIATPLSPQTGIATKRFPDSRQRLRLGQAIAYLNLSDPRDWLPLDPDHVPGALDALKVASSDHYVTGRAVRPGPSGSAPRVGPGPWQVRTGGGVLFFRG